MNNLTKYFKSSLGFKIAIPLMLMIITLMVLVTYFFTIRELNLRKNQVEIRMEQLAKNIATIRSVESEDWDIYQTYISNQLRLNNDIVYIAIFDENDELKVHALNVNWVDLGRKTTLTKLDQARVVLQLDQRQIQEESQKDLESKSVKIVIGERSLGTVKVGFSLVEINDEIRYNFLLNLALGIAFTILAMALAYYISNRIVTPLKRLTSAMFRISQGHFDEQVHIKSTDEIGDLAKTFNSMTKGLYEKQLIEKFNAELAFTIELQKIADLIAHRITAGLEAKSGYLFLMDNSPLSQFQLISTYPNQLTEKLYVKKNKHTCQLFLSHRNPLRLENLESYTDFIKPLSKLNLKKNSLICPIIIKEKVYGLLAIDARSDGSGYSDEEKRFLNTLIGQAGFAIESAMLYQELTEKERLKHELEIARKIQQSLLPQYNPQIEGLDIDGICQPAAEVGGDYFDYFKIADQKIGVVIADVTGKGTSAAFYMAVVKGIMLSLASIFESPRELMIELNRRLYGIMDRKVFITMIYAIIDLNENQLVFARAGHNSLLYRDAEFKKVHTLTPEGIGLGLESGSVFDDKIEEIKLSLSQGDLFVLYTDGISEAMNRNFDEFSEQKLIALINSSNNSSASQIRNQIIHELKEFVKDAPQHDDITLVTIRIE